MHQLAPLILLPSLCVWQLEKP